MYIKDFTGRGASVKGLCEGFLSGAPAHAYLLLGPSGVGKRTLANTLAQSLFCEGAPSTPCGVCPGCKRYAAGSHPDAYRILAPKSIGVDAIRDLIAALSSAPYEGGWRSIVIEQAGTMTTQAQNCLLKTLEEPPARTVFLLTAVSASQMLPTIRSRCRIVQVPPLAQGQVLSILEANGIAPDRAAQLAALSVGSIGRALEMDGDEGFWQLRDRLFGAVAQLHTPGDVLTAVNALRDDRQDAGRACDLLEGAIRDAMAAAVGVQGTARSAWPQLARADARALAALIGKVRHLRQMLASNVPWQAALERFLLEYSEEQATWQQS